MLQIVALSAIFSCLTITFGFFPSFGLSISLIIFALFAYSYVKKGNDTKLYFALSLAFSAFLFIRSEPLVTFFNFWAAIFFGVFMLTSGGKRPSGFLGFLFLPVSLFFNSLLVKTSNLNKFRLLETVFGIIVSLLVLVIILPLLASSNPIFENALKNLLEIFNLETLVQWFVRIMFFFIFLFIIPKILTLIEKEADHKLPLVLKPQPFPLQIPKVITSLVLILFFITQFQLYFASELNYSQTAREVFGQLGVVAAVVFMLMYNSQLKTKLSQRLNWLLGIEGIFLTLMAYKSVFEYVGAHGLTYVRLYGIVFATLVAGVFVLYKIHIRNQSHDFVKQVIIFTASMLLLVNILNFDYLIYHYNQPNVGHGVDYQYLSTLSADSLSYAQQFEALQEATFNKSFAGSYDNKNPLLLLYKIESLQGKYSDFDLREFNLLDYVQYERIKNIDTTRLRSYYENEANKDSVFTIN